METENEFLFNEKYLSSSSVQMLHSTPSYVLHFSRIFFIKTAEMLLIFMQFGFAGARSINVDRRRETAFEFTSSSRKRQEGDRESQTEFRLIYLFVN